MAVLRYHAMFLDVREVLPEFRRSSSEPLLTKLLPEAWVEEKLEYARSLPGRSAALLPKCKADGYGSTSTTASNGAATPGSSKARRRCAAEAEPPVDLGMLGDSGAPRAGAAGAATPPAPHAAGDLARVPRRARAENHSVAGSRGAKVRPKDLAIGAVHAPPPRAPAFLPFGGASVRAAERPQESAHVSNTTSDEDGVRMSRSFRSGSDGHPYFCMRPCPFLAKGGCRDGASCGFCHHPHMEEVQLDKRRREMLRNLEPMKACALILPALQKKVDAIDDSQNARDKFEALLRSCGHSIERGELVLARLSRHERVLHIAFKQRNVGLLLNDLVRQFADTMPSCAQAADDLLLHLRKFVLAVRGPQVLAL